MSVWVNFECECGNTDEWYRGREVICEKCGKEMYEVFSPKKNCHRVRVNDLSPLNMPEGF